MALPCRWRRRPQHQTRTSSALYSITSSARASKVAGTSRPSSFAVFRLMTSSYLVGACTVEFAWAGAFEDAVDIGGRAPEHVGLLAAIGQETAARGIVTIRVDCR